MKRWSYYGTHRTKMKHTETIDNVTYEYELPEMETPPAPPKLSKMQRRAAMYWHSRKPSPNGRIIRKSIHGSGEKNV